MCVYLHAVEPVCQISCRVQSFIRPNSTSDARRLTDPLMAAFQEISVGGLPNTLSHVAAEVFKRGELLSDSNEL